MRLTNYEPDRIDRDGHGIGARFPSPVRRVEADTDCTGKRIFRRADTDHTVNDWIRTDTVVSIDR